MKTVDTLVKDIYQLMETKEVARGVDIDDICERFGRTMADILKGELQPRPDNRKLRLSAIGKPDRQIYNKYHGVAAEPIRGATYIKFLYGHLTEAMMVALVEASGHTCTDMQKEVEVAGVKGHIDGRIDGVLMDIKSASSFGFKKFARNTLHLDDPFGYIAQLKAYAHSEGDTKYGWLAFDKQNGTLAWLQYDQENTTAPYYDAIDWDVEEHIERLKKMVSGELPSQCFSDVPDGKGGNRKLAMGCSYCDFKHTCFPDLRTFHYASGPRYLTVVAKDPRAMEIPDDF